MKIHPLTRLAILLIICIPLGFAACVKDNCKKIHSYTFYTPVYKTRADVRANIKTNAPRSITNPGKLFLLGNYIFLNEVDKGIHIIDNSTPAYPVNKGFIDIPGNLDLAVKGNTLYADLYTDLVTIDISNPGNIQVKKIIDGVFPYRIYGGGFVTNNMDEKIITDWVRHDTTITENCERPMNIFFGTDVFMSTGPVRGGGTATASSPIGQGGSMARFALLGDRLYTVTDTHLDVFNITNSFDPVNTNSVNVGWNIETIYPFRDKLFIGSMTAMYIYDVSYPDAPAHAGEFQHVLTCDPVIADDEHAYFTLRSGTPCRGGNSINALEILQLNNLVNPSLVKIYNLTNPHGLSKSGNTLFICDGSDGLKVFNTADVRSLKLIKHFPGMETYDVIAYNNLALVVAKDGLYQYDYSNINNIHLVSKIGVIKK